MVKSFILAFPDTVHNLGLGDMRGREKPLAGLVHRQLRSFAGANGDNGGKLPKWHGILFEFGA